MEPNAQQSPDVRDDVARIAVEGFVTCAKLPQKPIVKAIVVYSSKSRQLIAIQSSVPFFLALHKILFFLFFVITVL